MGSIRANIDQRRDQYDLHWERCENKTRSQRGAGLGVRRGTCTGVQQASDLATQLSSEEMGEATREKARVTLRLQRPKTVDAPKGWEGALSVWRLRPVRIVSP